MNRVFTLLFVGLLVVVIAPSGFAVAAEQEQEPKTDGLAVAEAQEEGPTTCNLEPYLDYLRQIQDGTYVPTATDESENQSAEEQGRADQLTDDNTTSTAPNEEAATSTEPSEPADAESSGVAKPDELTVRKELTVRVIDCAIVDTIELRESIESLTLVGAEEDSLQDRFLGRIDGAVEYYETQKNTVKSDNTTIADTKKLARSVRDWRANEYKKLERNSRNFIMWVRNQELLDTAYARLAQVRKTIKEFKLGKHDLVEDSFDRARFFVDRARDANRKAQTALIHDKPPQEVLEDLKDAVSDLYRVYNEFFTLSGTVKGYLITQ